jgi:cytochrome c oxidase subunit 2
MPRAILPPRSARSALVRATPLVLTVLVLSSCARSGAPAAATTQGQDIRDLWDVFFAASIGVAVVVDGLILWSVLRHGRMRRDDGELPRQVREHVPIEILYTAVPVVIVGVLFAITLRADHGVTAEDPSPAATIHVEAFRWGWRFTYDGVGTTSVSTPGAPPPELVIPAGRPVRILLTAPRNDVIHAFYVPDFLFKRDAIPGHPTEFDLTATREGTYDGTCAEFCGLNHAFMPFVVRVVSEAEFETWLARPGSSP